MASGWGGQWIVVVPEADLVFVTAAGGYSDPVPLPADRMLSDYVLAAIR
jgi:CubicO group peptidase (beta-lactamase class C family)